MASTPVAAVESSESRIVSVKAAKGAVALGGRQFLVHGLNVAGSVCLARLLSPTDFGTYAIVMFLLQFLGSFGGTGLACNLIRMPNEPEEDEYRAVFAFQQLALTILVLALWIVSPYIAKMYGLPAHYVWLFRMTAVSLLITSFMVIPQVRLEREINFTKLAVVEVWQAAVFNASAVSLAWIGWGGMSFSVALVARSITGVIAVNAAEPWKPHWRLDWKRAKPHLSFGLYYQSSQVLSLVKDAIAPVLIGVLAGAAAVGYISWANMLASYPVLLLMILQRVYIPAFSRLQHDRTQLATFLESVLFATNAIAAPIAIITLALVHPITNLIFGLKWTNAIPMFFLFWSANLFIPASTPILGMLNALGRSKVCFGFTVLWAGLNWAFSVPLILWLGPIGVAWAAAMLQLFNLPLFAVARRELKFHTFRPAVFPWTVAIAVGGCLWLLQQFYVIHSVLVLIACCLAGAGVYAGFLLVRYGQQLRGLFISQWPETL